MSIVNNFRKMNLSYNEEPPYLVEYGEHNSCLIFSSSFNPIVYVIYNPKDTTYHVFEDQGSDNILNDLKQNIETYFKQE